MRKWIDALLSRWYVPRHSVHILPAIVRDAQEWERWEDRFALERGATSRIVITTDYQRGTPCS